MLVGFRNQSLPSNPQLLLALIVLNVAVKVSVDLFLTPQTLLSHLAGAGGH